MNNRLLYVIISFVIISAIFCSNIKEIVKTDEETPGKSKTKIESSETKKEVSQEKNKEKSSSYTDFTTMPHYWLALTIRGGYIFLLSPYDDYYSSTPMFNFIATLNPKLIDNLIPEIELGWSPVGLKVKTDAYGNLFMSGINLRYEYPVSDVVGLNTSLGGGVIYESYNVNSEYVNDKSFTNPYLKGALGLDININYTYNLNITGEYRYFAYKDRDMQGLAGLIGFSYRFGADPQSELNSYLEVLSKIHEVYPAKTPYYSLNGIGELKLKNNLKRKIKSAKISFYCSDYMDVPSYSKTINDIQPDSEHKFNIRSVFNNKIHSINENKEVSSVIKVLYKFEDDKRVYEYMLTEDVRFMRRNALTWEDTSNLGSFITFNDNPVKEFARDCISIVGNHWEDEDKYIPATNIRKAIAIWSGVQSVGLKYVSDPKGFKSSFNKKYNVDYVQYPRDILKQKTGDCDDFVVLYCSLLENVGINTALITVPGHIFMAIDVGVTPYEAITIGLKEKEIIIRDDTVWLPVESTYLATGKSFSEAWAEGLRSMNMAKSTTEIITTTYCHSKYKPTPLNHTDYSIKPQVASLQIYLSNIKPFRDTRYIKTIRNPLVRAVAYARFRMYNKAVRMFKKLMRKNRKINYAIYTNIGNILYEQKKYLESKKHFERALAIKDKYLPAVVGMVRVSETTDRAADVNKYMAMLPSQIREKISMINRLSDRAYMVEHNKLFWAIK